jgi:transposase
MPTQSGRKKGSTKANPARAWELYQQYKNDWRPIKIIADELGVSVNTVHVYLRVYRATAKRRKPPTKAQLEKAWRMWLACRREPSLLRKYGVDDGVEYFYAKYNIADIARVLGVGIKKAYVYIRQLKERKIQEAKSFALEHHLALIERYHRSHGQCRAAALRDALPKSVRWLASFRPNNIPHRLSGRQVRSTARKCPRAVRASSSVS